MYYFNDGMHVIGHNHKIMQCHITRTYVFRIQPFLFCNSSRLIRHHFAIDDFAEQTQLIMATNGDEIQPFA